MPACLLLLWGAFEVPRLLAACLSVHERMFWRSSVHYTCISACVGRYCLWYASRQVVSELLVANVVSIRRLGALQTSQWMDAYVPLSLDGCLFVCVSQKGACLFKHAVWGAFLYRCLQFVAIQDDLTGAFFIKCCAGVT